MKNVIEVLSRSLVNLNAEKNNIGKEIVELNESIKSRQQDCLSIDVKIKELEEAINLLKGTKNVTTSKNKKVK